MTSADEARNESGRSEVAQEPPAPPRPDWLADWTDRTRAWVRVLFPLVLFMAAAYMFDTHRPVWLGLALFAWSIVSLVFQTLRPQGRDGASDLVNLTAESRCNTVLHVNLDIETILAHPAVEELHRRLQARSRLDLDVTCDEWRASLLGRFRELRRIEPEFGARERVDFDFAGGQLFVNKEKRSRPYINHELLIREPSLKFQSTATGNDEDWTYYGLKIRVVVVNGILKVQMGEWDKEIGVADRETDSDWRAWDTITTFPLLLNPLARIIHERA